MPIGGYLPLEFSVMKSLIYPEAYPVNLGRTGLKLIVQKKNYRRVWLPEYICPVVFDALKSINVPYATYKIDKNMDPIIDFEVKEWEAFLYVNYFGIKNKTVEYLSQNVPNFIADLTQAFFYHPLPGVLAFNSARKFIGVPDGGFCFGDFINEITLPRQSVCNNCKHLLMRAEGLVEEGYPFFKENEIDQKKWNCKKMSLLTEKILRSVDFENIKGRRIENFKILHKTFHSYNELKFDIEEETVPLCYPLLIPNGKEWKRELCQKKIFVPTYWPDIEIPDNWTRYLIDNLVCLPIDQNCNCNSFLPLEVPNG